MQRVALLAHIVGATLTGCIIVPGVATRGVAQCPQPRRIWRALSRLAFRGKALLSPCFVATAAG